MNLKESDKCNKQALNRKCSFVVCHICSSKIGKCRQREVCFTCCFGFTAGLMGEGRGDIIV